MAGFRVLLVDDEAEFVDTLVRRMKLRDINVFAVGSGEEALAFLDENSVDVMVLDVKMPGLDGIQTLKEVKALHPRVEVIMLTGYANMEAGIEGMELGAFDYLMKPMDIDELLYKIEDASKRKSMPE